MFGDADRRYMNNLGMWGHLKFMLRPHVKKISVIFLLMLTLSGLNMIIPFYQQKIVDEGILNNDLHLVIRLLFYIFVILFLSGLITALQNYLQSDISLKVGKKLELSILEHALKLKYCYLKEQGIYKIVKDTDRYVQSVIDLTGGKTIQILVELFKFVGIFIALLMLDWKITLYLLATIPLRIIITKILSSSVEKNSEKSCSVQKYIHGWEDNIYNSFLQIKIWNLVEMKAKEYNKLLESRNKIVKKHFFITGIDSAIGNSFMQIVINTLYLFCGILIIKSDMTVGTMLTFISYSGFLLQPISLISYLKIIISKMQPEFEIYKNFISLPEENKVEQIEQFPTNKEITLLFKEVSFGYGERKVINNLTFEMKTGDIVAVVGENGAGKTTFINLILRLYSPCSGQILLNNMDVQRIDMKSYRDNICTVLQFDDLFTGTIEENLTVYKQYDLSEELLNNSLFKFISKYEKGLSTKIENKSSGVSGGEKQKIALLRALNKNGRILILDEATSNYDQESEKEFIDLMKKINYDIIILVTHNKKILNIANKIVKIEKNDKMQKE